MNKIKKEKKKRKKKKAKKKMNTANYIDKNQQVGDGVEFDGGGCGGGRSIKRQSISLHSFACMLACIRASRDGDYLLFDICMFC